MQLTDIIIGIITIISVGTIFHFRKSAIKKNQTLKLSISFLLFGIATFGMVLVTTIIINNNIDLFNSVTIENSGIFTYYGIQSILATPILFPYVVKIFIAVGMLLLCKYYLINITKE